MQNPGADGVRGIQDDVLATLNNVPVDVSSDANPGPNYSDPMDRVRGFYSFHPGGVPFLLGDGAVRAMVKSGSLKVYQRLSALNGVALVNEALQAVF